MLYISGNKNDLKIKEVSEIGSPVNMPSYKSALATNHGGVSDDYSILQIDPKSATADKLKTGATYEPVWKDGELTDISFATWDSKKTMKFTSDKKEIVANGVDECIITIKIYDAKGEIEENTDLSNVYIPIQSPTPFVKAKVKFVHGEATIRFKTTESGTWVFPSNINGLINDFRILSSVTIDALIG
jgi:hypothetical protein